MINALNSGARVFMADLEDSLSPTWANVVGGQAALIDAVRRTLTFDQPEGKAVPAQRRDGDAGRPAAWLASRSSATCWSTASRSRPRLFDFGLFVFHNARELVRRGSGPYFYLPKLESHHEARLWNDVFMHGPGGARDPARDDPGDRPDRDDPGGVRDGRDPVRAARARRRAQRRALGLPVQLHQEVPLAARPGPARPGRS